MPNSLSAVMMEVPAGSPEELAVDEGVDDAPGGDGDLPGVVEK